MKVKQRKSSKRFRAPTRSSPTKKSEVAGSLPEVASVDSKVANRVIRMPNSQLIKTSMVSDLTRMHAASSSNASNNNVINNSDKANIKEKQLKVNSQVCSFGLFNIPGLLKIVSNHKVTRQVLM